MRDFDDTWRPGRIMAFLSIGLALYAGLFLWSEKNLRKHSDGNPFYKISAAPEHSDWIILGASHALPLGFSDIPDHVRSTTGKSILTLAITGGGPFTWRVIAERYFADHTAEAVLIVLDEFGFADARWNARRVGDADVLPKIPADFRTIAVLAGKAGDEIPVGAFAAYVTGFAKINDHARFEIDRWDGEDKFDATPRPSDAADRARIAFLYPGPADLEAILEGLADLDAVIRLAHSRNTSVVVVRPPLPDRFRTRLPELPDFERRLLSLLEEHRVPMHDFSALIPEPHYYFDTDHLNRKGVERFVNEELAGLLRNMDDRSQ